MFDMHKMVADRLKTYGFEPPSSADNALIDLCTTQVEGDILAYCNVTVIPEAMYAVFADRVTGQFLITKKNAGLFTEAELNLESVEKSIKVGDTDVTFADGQATAETRFDILAVSLLMSGNTVLRHNRRIKW